MEDNGYQVGHIWKCIWKLQVPERVRCFIWILNHERFLTGYRRNLHGFGQASYLLCGNVSKTTLHALRNYKYAMEAWASKIPSRILSKFFSLDLHEWVNIIVNVAAHEEIDWSRYWVIGCHSI